MAKGIDNAHVHELFAGSLGIELLELTDPSAYQYTLAD
jgi:hypothetical protein